MKLFLASAIDKTLHKLKPLIPKVGKKVLFIPNASDPYKEKWFVDLDKKAFKKQGYVITELDLRKITARDFEKRIERFDLIHFAGGSVYYLTALLKTKHFDKILLKAIKNDKIIYTGTSAGSIIVSKNIKPVSYDSEEAKYLKSVPDNKGMGLIDFVIIPHSNQPDFIKENIKATKNLPKDMQAVFFIHDKQAIWVNQDNIQLIV
ncbi:Type 1 glutamine amidotransferase-like domain-containing protein [Patescibacteria group bacterium]